MTRLLPLPAGRPAMAESVAVRLANLSSRSLAGGEMEIGETFPVHFLRRGDLPSGRQLRRIGHVVGPAKHWHVQLRSRGTPVLAAQAQVVPKGDWEVLNVFGAPLAAKVAEAVHWVDQDMPEPGVARMLAIPVKRIFALWIEQPTRDRIVLINGARRTRGLSTECSYTVHRFVNGLFGRYVRMRD